LVPVVAALLDAGARIIGACCGSTPDHIRAFRAAMDAYLAAKV
jgi:5-methyltetrahydrofolate--homocysteine methyltransferase